ncbi:MAG TPA: DinB family protein [Gemmatimonadales bacterium]|nr:DinB family protein [Gemmatimonadales bacterium]
MSVLEALLRGFGAHADPVASFDGLTLEQAGARPAGIEQSIWQLLWHLNYWMDYELRSIRGPEVPYPEHAALSWPVDPHPPDLAAWERERRRFADQLERLAAVSRSSDEVTRVVHPAMNESVGDVLWQMVAHNSYHIGQVVQLRRAMGAWPPAAGGDTW